MNNNDVKPLKRKKDNIDENIDINNENTDEIKIKKLPKNKINKEEIKISLDNKTNIQNKDNLEEIHLNLEINLHSYEICINHLEYLIQCYNKTINFYKNQHNIIYDITKLKETIDYLNDVKNDCFENE